jgi:hypothetical protein
MTARRYRDLFEDICADLGGQDILSEGQRQLAKRAAMLSAEAERMEAMACRDERITAQDWSGDRNHKFDLNDYGVICDRLGCLFDRLGLERRAKDVTESDVIKHFKRRVQKAPGERGALSRQHETSRRTYSALLKARLPHRLHCAA